MALGTASTLHGLAVLGSCCLTERKRAALEGRGNETGVKRKKKTQRGKEREGGREERVGKEEGGGRRELDVLSFDSPSFLSIGWTHLPPHAIK